MSCLIILYVIMFYKSFCQETDVILKFFLFTQEKYFLQEHFQRLTLRHLFTTPSPFLSQKVQCTFMLENVLLYFVEIDYFLSNKKVLMRLSVRLFKSLFNSKVGLKTEPKCLQKLLKYLQGHPYVAVGQPKIYPAPCTMYMCGS